MNPPSTRMDLQAAGIHAELGMPLPRNTRMRLFKHIVLRLARVVTHHQVAFNREMLAAVEELLFRTSEIERSLRRVSADIDEEVASVTSALVDIQQRVIALEPGRAHDDGSRTERIASTPSPPRPDGAAEGDTVSRRGADLGVNVFGDWAATTGLAQAARRLTVGLHEAGFDLSLNTVRTGAPVDDSRIPSVLRDLPGDRPYDVDLWMLNINEFPGITDALLRPPGRMTHAVAIWYWELPTFPSHLVAQMNRVDEIWVATQFVKSSFQRATDRPVHVVPAIVPQLKGSGLSRTDFGLADDEVVFLFSFDVHSIVARKNPGAVIEAFARAFPSSSTSRSRLVIKVLNLDRHPDVARWLQPLVATVDGVLIADDLRQKELVDLFLAADVYVSLHRSEGFGFGIAEAMSLGKPVIATAYSGNLDFTTPNNSCQVGYRLRKITDDDHVFNEGSSSVYQAGAEWAEPDVGQAARWMQLLAADPALRARIGEAGRATIEERYSTSVAIEAVANRLKAAHTRSGDT